VVSLLLALTLPWTVAGAAESAWGPVLARVLAVDAGRVTLELEDAPEGVPPRVTVEPTGVPAVVAPGRWVRLWPAAGGSVAEALAGARLDPLIGRGMDGDRTGVRARLSRGAGRAGSLGGHGAR
jgi:hypothetical protein